MTSLKAWQRARQGSQGHHCQSAESGAEAQYLTAAMVMTGFLRRAAGPGMAPVQEP